MVHVGKGVGLLSEAVPYLMALAASYSFAMPGTGIECFLEATFLFLFGSEVFDALTDPYYVDHPLGPGYKEMIDLAASKYLP